MGVTIGVSDIPDAYNAKTEHVSLLSFVENTTLTTFYALIASNQLLVPKVFFKKMGTSNQTLEAAVKAYLKWLKKVVPPTPALNASTSYKDSVKTLDAAVNVLFPLAMLHTLHAKLTAATARSATAMSADEFARLEAEFQGLFNL